VLNSGETEGVQRLVSTGQQQRNRSVPHPYVRGESEKISRAFRKHGINTYHVSLITACTI